MGFFDKKQCGICGKDAGRLLAYTLKDNKHLCDECFHKIYTGFNSLNAQFSLEHYRDHYLPYYEKTKKMRESLSGCMRTLPVYYNILLNKVNITRLINQYIADLI